MSAKQENGNGPDSKPDWIKWSCGQCPDFYLDENGRGRCKRKAPNVLQTKWHGCEARKKEVLDANKETV